MVAGRLLAIAVLILYSHPLFGDGLLELLARETGLEVSAIRADDVEAVERALLASPQVVIAESSPRRVNFAVVSSSAKHATAPHMSAMPVMRWRRSWDASSMVEDRSDRG